MIPYKRLPSIIRRQSNRVSSALGRRNLSAPENQILIGTHHKTGTVWLKKIFRRICYELDWNLHDSGTPYPASANVVFENHSQFPLADIEYPIRGIHMIRDPRDRVVSGCFYHQKSSEQWLHEKRAEFGGKTYQEMINSYDNFADKLMFELEHSGKRGITEMLAWNYSDPRFKEIKYEELINDVNLEMFHSAFTFVGFTGEIIPTALKIAYENSLFSGRIGRSVHVRSGSTGQWKNHFEHRHRERFEELFPGALVRLGYEDSADWIFEDDTTS